MKKLLWKVFLVFEVLFVIVSVAPSLLWFLINFYYIKYKNNKVKKKVLKILNSQGLPERLSEEITEMILPEVKIQDIGEIIYNERRFFRKQNK